MGEDIDNKPMYQFDIFRIVVDDEKQQEIDSYYKSDINLYILKYIRFFFH